MSNEYKDKLHELYGIAVSQQNVSMALEIVERLRNLNQECEGAKSAEQALQEKGSERK